MSADMTSAPMPTARNPVVSKGKEALDWLSCRREELKKNIRDLARRIEQSPDFSNMVRDFEAILTNPAKRQRTRPNMIRVGNFVDPVSGSVFPALLPLDTSRGIAYFVPKHGLANAANALQRLAFRFVASLRPHYSRLILIDGVGVGACFGPLLRLDKKITGDVFSIAGQNNEITRVLGSVSQEVQERIRKLQTIGFSSWGGFLASDANIKSSYVLILLHGFPRGMSSSDAERISRICEWGPLVGIHLAMTWDEDADTRAISENVLKDVADFVYQLKSSGSMRINYSDPAYAKFLGESSCRLELDCGEIGGADIAPMIKKTNEMIEKKATNLTYSSIITDEPSGLVVDDLICIPIGQDDLGKPIEYRISSVDKDGARNSLILGRPGSGKSSLLHALIISGAWKYDPEHLQFYLLDLGGGMEFQFYKDLPHAKMVAATTDIAFGSSVLEHLQAVITERAKLFKRHGVENIVLYRKRSGTPLPSLIVIVDEFHNLLFGADRNKSQRSLEKIAKEGRKFGLFLVLATQTLAEVMLDTGTKNQIDARILFKSNSDGDVRVIIPGNEAWHDKLTAVGEGIYMHDFRSPPPRLFRAAYDEDKDIYLDRLKDRYTVGGKRLFYSESQAPSITTNPELFSARKIDGKPLNLFLGQPTRLNANITLEHIAVPLLRKQGQNIIALGGDDDGSMVQLVSLCATQFLSACPGGTLCLLDGRGRLDSMRTSLTATAKKSDSLLLWANSVEDSLVALESIPIEENESDTPETLLIVTDAHRFANSIIMNKSDDNEPEGILNDLLIHGGNHGIHVLLIAPTVIEGREMASFCAPGEYFYWRIYLTGYGKSAFVNDDVVESGLGLLVGGANLRNPDHPVRGFQIYGDLADKLDEQELVTSNEFNN